MNLLADENVDRQIVERIRHEGFNVGYIAETESGENTNATRPRTKIQNRRALGQILERRIIRSPLSSIEQMSYLIFMKRLEDMDAMEQKKAPKQEREGAWELREGAGWEAGTILLILKVAALHRERSNQKRNQGNNAAIREKFQQSSYLRNNA